MVLVLGESSLTAARLAFLRGVGNTCYPVIYYVIPGIATTIIRRGGILQTKRSMTFGFGGGLHSSPEPTEFRTGTENPTDLPSCSILCSSTGASTAATRSGTEKHETYVADRMPERSRPPKRPFRRLSAVLCSFRCVQVRVRGRAVGSSMWSGFNIRTKPTAARQTDRLLPHFPLPFEGQGPFGDGSGATRQGFVCRWGFVRIRTIYFLVSSRVGPVERMREERV